MIVKLPGENNKWVQYNSGEISGNLWATYNIDLTSNPGRVRVSAPTTIVCSGLDSTAIVHPVAFVKTSADTSYPWRAIGGDYVLRQPSAGGAFVIDNTANVPTTDYRYSDLCEWESTAGTLSLFCTTSTSIAKLTAGTWTTDWYMGTLSASTLQSSTAHPLCVGFNNLLLVGDGQYISTINNAGTVDETRLTFEKEYEVVWIKSSNSAYYIGCRNTQGRQGKVFVWDGYSENFNSDYKIGSSDCFAGIIKDDVCYCVNGAGQLLAFNGGGFSEVARFPIKDHDSLKWTDPDAVNFQIHRNGMTLINNNIHILVNAYLNDNYMLPNFLSGVWEYTKDTGLYHKYSLTKDTGSGIIDYGSPILYSVGALAPIDVNSGNFFAGAYIGKAGDGNLLGVIDKVSTSASASKVGYFITPKIQASEINENWQKLVILIKKLLNATDKIYVKYRVDNKYFGTAELVRSTITWVNATNFTCSVSDFQTYAAVGDEVEIMQGEGSGLSTNITAIDGTMFTIDESVTGASGEAYARVCNWKKMGTDIATQDIRMFELPINDPSSWIQFKVVCFFANKEKEQNEIEKLILKGEPQIRL